MTEPDPHAIAFDAIPGLRHAERALAVIAAHRRAAFAEVDRPAPDLAAEVVAAALAGEPLPADLGKRAIDAQNHAAYLRAEHELLARAERSLTARREQALRSGVDHGLRALRALLADALDQVRGVADTLSGIHNADQAIEAGASGQWRALMRAVDQYRAVREAQADLFRDSQHGPDIALGQWRAGEPGSVPMSRLLTVAGELSNIDETWQGWHAYALPRRPPPGWSDIDPDAIPPWPHHPAEPLRPIVGPAYLRWLATHETAVAWVPTIGEAVGAYVDQVTDVRRRERQAEELARYGRVLTPDERTRRNDREFDRVQRAARCAASSAQR